MDGSDLLRRFATETAGDEPPRRAARKAILVLGMSRSGTSLLTQILHRLGAALPDDLIGPGHGNPLGHWEPRSLAALNERILNGLGRGWDDPRPLPPRCFRSRGGYDALQAVQQEIRSLYGDAALMVIKDPRICRLLPLYLEALDLLDIEPLVVLAVRPVTEVAQSLADRDGLHPNLAELLWLRSLTEAEFHSRTCRRVWVGFDQMIADWRSSVGRIADGLGIDWPLEVDIAEPAVAAALKPRWRHDVTPEVRAATGCGLGASAWGAIQDALDRHDTAARFGFDTIRAALADMDRLYAPAIDESVRRHQAEIDALHQSACWRVTGPLRAISRFFAGAGATERP